MKKRNNEFLLPLMIALLISIICMSGRDVQADIGAKPSITLNIVNAPKEYYVAFLEIRDENWRDTWTENIELIFDDVNDSTIERYLKDFHYNGYFYHQSPVGNNFYKSNSAGDYTFGYMVPDPFRVILVGTDGTVHLSGEMNQKEYNTVCTYDVSTAEVTEHREEKIALRIINTIICYILTVFIELLILYFFRYPFSRRNLLLVILVNTFTNLPLNIFLTKGETLFVLIYTIMGETVIILLESLIYTFTLKNKEVEIKRLKNFLYGVVANVVSAILSVVAHFIFLIFFG